MSAPIEERPPVNDVVLGMVLVAISGFLVGAFIVLLAVVLVAL
jgi:hypothetical protein